MHVSFSSSLIGENKERGKRNDGERAGCILEWGFNRYIQGVPGGMCQTSGECSLGQSIPI